MLHTSALSVVLVIFAVYLVSVFDIMTRLCLYKSLQLVVGIIHCLG